MAYFGTCQDWSARLVGQIGGPDCRASLLGPTCWGDSLLGPRGGDCSRLNGAVLSGTFHWVAFHGLRPGHPDRATQFDTALATCLHSSTPPKNINNHCLLKGELYEAHSQSSVFGVRLICAG